MKLKYVAITGLILLLIIPQLVSASVEEQGNQSVSKDTATRSEKDLMHPKINVFDADGNHITDTAHITQLSTAKTCGQCHDVEFIDDHNNHFTETVKTDCVACHMQKSSLGSDLEAINRRIQLPDNHNCAQCHGFVHFTEASLTIPDDFECMPLENPRDDHYQFTRYTGVIIAAQDLFESSMNLENKNNLHFPWDVHARRQLKCIDCHFLSNDPRYCGEDLPELGHLRRDPRKIKSPGEILKRPDHMLKTSSCTCCHDPFAIHENLPYKKRHMDVLDCRACHVPKIYGPALQSLDNTSLTVNGDPLFTYRSADEEQSHGTTLNTTFFKGYRPYLFTHKLINKYNREETKIYPFNLVTHWYWISGKTKQPVSNAVLQQVYFSDGTPGTYARDIINTFDGNNDKEIDAREIRLDTPEKTEFVKNKLVSLGIESPEIIGTVDAHKVTHGVLSAGHMKLNCSDCHATGSRIGQDVLLADFAPGNATPTLNVIPETLIDGKIQAGENGNISLLRGSSIPGYYVLGHGRIGILDSIGWWIFVLTLIGIIAHAGLRFVSSRKFPQPHVKTKSTYMYRFYERLWHWTMAFGILLLAVTGLEIHYTGSFSLFGLETAVPIHNILAAILVINGALSLFYHLTTGEIKTFFGFNNKFFKETIVQAYYYIYGIFKGHPHPINKTLERKLNPLQQLTYIILLNILLPFQIITGILMWGTERWPLLSENLGGLSFLAPLHNLGAWLFLAFIVMHVYLTTTGHTLFSNIKAMITGYDDVAEDEKNEEYHQMMEMKMVDLVGTLIEKSKGRK